MCYSKIIVAAIIILNVAFTAGVLAVFWHTGAEPTAIVAAWFAFTTGELWMLKDIKCTKEGKKKTQGKKEKEVEG